MTIKFRDIPANINFSSANIVTIGAGPPRFPQAYDAAYRLMRESPPEFEVLFPAVSGGWRLYRALLSELMAGLKPIMASRETGPQVLVWFEVDQAWHNEFARWVPVDIQGAIGAVLNSVVDDYVPALDVQKFLNDQMSDETLSAITATVQAYERELVAMGARTAIETAKFRLGMWP